MTAGFGAPAFRLGVFFTGAPSAACSMRSALPLTNAQATLPRARFKIRSKVCRETFIRAAASTP